MPDFTFTLGRCADERGERRRRLLMSALWWAKVLSQSRAAARAKGALCWLPFAE